MNFWKIYKLIMLFVIIAVVVFDVTASVVHNHFWNEYYLERKEAVEAGYDKEYTVCSREENVVLDSVEYLHFHAFRPMVIDGSYNEELLVRCDSEYLDKAPNKTEGLILFGKKESFYNDLRGTSYTLIELYSVCDYPLNYDAKVFGFFNAVIVTCFGIILEIILIFTFVALKSIKGAAMKQLKRGSGTNDEFMHGKDEGSSG